MYCATEANDAAFREKSLAQLTWIDAEHAPPITKVRSLAAQAVAIRDGDLSSGRISEAALFDRDY